jgi:Fur family peroxide stress response transcriptional regulator
MEVKRKNSKKRQAILEALCATKEHPTAEMLYNQLKPDYPELSLGTVYRNLSILAEDGLVTTVVRVAGQERYDADTSPHAHFVCRECKRVMDMNMPEVIGSLSQKLDEEYGFAVERCSLNLTGLCMECRKAQAN